MYADLHTHTHISDGMSSIDELLEKAHKAGVKKLAITDHDSFFHIDEAIEKAKRYDIEIIRGVEMSCYDFNVNKKIHIVALNFDQKATHIKPLTDRVLQHRDDYHKKMIQDFNEMGYKITYEDCKKFAPHNIVFKMDIFLAIMDKYGDEIDPGAFYKEHFSKPSDVNVDRHMGYIDIKEGIEAIHKDGGVAILAHPNAYDNFPEAEEYIGYGLDGIEISHPVMEEEHVEMAQQLADKHNLILSGGSDYHGGKNIPEFITVGQCGLNKEQFEILESRLNQNKK